MTINTQTALILTMLVSLSAAAQDSAHPAKRQLTLTPGEFTTNVVRDQKSIWTSPFRLKEQNLNWIVPLSVLGAATISADSAITKQLPHSKSLVSHSATGSNLVLGAMLGVPAVTFSIGELGQDQHRRETGLLSAEASVDSAIFSTLIKIATGRERISASDKNGSFGVGGSSFPSEHSAVSWAVASVLAHEYPGGWTKALAYGGAASVSIARVLAQKHFTSDVLVGGAAGWLIGRWVYDAHHDPSLPGSEWGTFKAAEDRGTADPGRMGTTYLELDSWIYQAFDELVAKGYVPSLFLGMRPWTRMECARALADLNEKLDQTDDISERITSIENRLNREFAPELARLSGSANRELVLDSVFVGARLIGGEPLRDSLHLGLTNYGEFGRPYGTGANFADGFSARGTFDRIAFYLRGEYQRVGTQDSYALALRQQFAAIDDLPEYAEARYLGRNRLDLVEGYVSFALGGVEISAGKQAVQWGPTRDGAMILSNDAEPLVMLRFDRASPATLPWVFHWLGPYRTQLFLAPLQNHSYPSDPWLHGERLSFKPTPNLELGFSRTVVFAGSGHPFTAASFYHSFFSLGDKGKSASPAQDVGDRKSGFDISYRLPALRWVTLYTDSLADDDPLPLAAPQRSAWQPGIFISHFPGIQNLDFRADAPFTDLPVSDSVAGTFVYWNVNYKNSYSNRGNLLGSWVGREGKGLAVTAGYNLKPPSRLELEYRQLNVDGDFVPGGGTQRSISLRCRKEAGQQWLLSGGVQIERWAFPILSSTPQTNLAISFSLTYNARLGFGVKPR